MITFDDAYTMVRKEGSCALVSEQGYFAFSANPVDTVDTAFRRRKVRPTSTMEDTRRIAQANPGCTMRVRDRSDRSRVVYLTYETLGPFETTTINALRRLQAVTTSLVGHLEGVERRVSKLEKDEDRAKRVKL